MKYLFIFLAFISPLCSFSQDKPSSENVILVTLDGYRWQEMFGGAQKKVLRVKKYAADPAKLTERFGDPDPQKARAKLMPFMWNVIAKQGQIYGDKKIGNKMTLTNGYKFSYPGYNEIMTGWGDRKINSNDYPNNPNYNIFDFLVSKKEFQNKLLAVATWDAFPRIINDKRNHVPVYVNLKADSTGAIHIKNINKPIDFDKWETKIPAHNPYAKTDTFTYQFAKEYLQRYHPRFSFIGFDETDDYAHDGNYTAYLNTANTLDAYMQDLWNFVQSDPQYKDKTTIIITCDHGRGDVPILEWRHHGHVYGAEYIWMAVMGPGIIAKGEVTAKIHLHQNQLAATIVEILGYEYKPNHFAGKPIPLNVPADKK
jgi:hypothetical protein